MNVAHMLCEYGVLHPLLRLDDVKPKRTYTLNSCPPIPNLFNPSINSYPSFLESIGAFPGAEFLHI